MALEQRGFELHKSTYIQFSPPINRINVFSLPSINDFLNHIFFSLGYFIVIRIKYI